MRSVSLRATFSPGNSYFLLPLLVLVLLLSHREEDEFGFEVLPGEFFGFDDGEGAFITGGFTHEGGDTLAEAGEVAFLRAIVGHDVQINVWYGVELFGFEDEGDELGVALDEFAAR